MEFKDYYHILDVAPDAETSTIKAAYRRMARKYHPDLNPGKESEEKFKEVAEAWEVLKDKRRRAEYDELRRYGGQHRQQFEPPPGWRTATAEEFQNIGGDFSDFFRSFFGRDFDIGSRESWRFAHARGQDIEINMPVFLEETVRENRKLVNYVIPAFGQGELHNINKALNVTIPAGVTHGERIRVKGQGAPGVGDGLPGDLYLHINLVPHPLFDVEGHNLVVTVPVAPWELALGTKVLVPTLEGKISLTIPPGSKAGQRLRARGGRAWWERLEKAICLRYSKSACLRRIPRKLRQSGSLWLKKLHLIRERDGGEVDGHHSNTHICSRPL